MKNRQALILLFSANAISGFAQGVSMLAIPWYFARQDLSSQFNLIFGFVTFATVFWGLYAGAMVDRFARKGLFLGTNLAEGLILIFVAIVGWQNGALPTGLVILVFATTVFGYRMHYPNLYAFAQEITPPAYYTKVTSYIEIVGQATNVLAGALAVVLLEGVDYQGKWWLLGEFHFVIESWKIHEIFTLDAATYFISVILIAFIKYIPDKKFEVEKGKLIDRLKTGFRFLIENPIILLFGFFSHSIFVIMLVSLFAVMPMYITNYLRAGGQVFGTMEVLYGLGALSAGIFISRLTQHITKTKAIITLMLLTTIILALCMVVKSVPYYFLVGLTIGFTNAGTRVLRVSYLFNHIPNQVIGRVNSIFSLLNIIMRGIFVMIFSLQFFSRDTNIIYAYAIMASLTFISGLVLWKNYKKITTHQPPRQSL